MNNAVAASNGTPYDFRVGVRGRAANGEGFERRVREIEREKCLREREREARHPGEHMKIIQFDGPMGKLSKFGASK